MYILYTRYICLSVYVYNLSFVHKYLCPNQKCTSVGECLRVRGYELLHTLLERKIKYLKLRLSTV